MGLEHVVPIMPGWPEALDSRMEEDHGLGHVLADGIGVKAAVEGMPLADERSQPAWIGSGAGGGDAAVLWMEGKAADGINGRLHQDGGWPRLRRDGEKAPVLF
jgi:hypothetical protein